MALLSIPVGFIGYYFNKFIIKYERVMYGLALAFSVLALFYLDSEHLWVLKDGFFSLSLFIVVMYTGGFKRNSKINKKLRSVRKIFSIMGFIFIIPHGVMYMKDIVDGDLEASKITLLGLITVGVMLPLFIISFKFIKKRMSIKKWVYYQKYSYIAYFTLFLHLVLINNSNALLYIGIFGFYFALKLKNYLFLSIKPYWKLAGLILILGGLYSIGNSNESSAKDVGIDFSELPLVDGVYNVYADSYLDYRVVLQVTIFNNDITNIIIIDHGSTDPNRKPQYYAAAVDMVNLILQENSTDIDAISGATETTEGVINAVEMAIELATIEVTEEIE